MDDSAVIDSQAESYFQLALDLFCIADTDGYFKKLNAEWENALGYQLSELEGHRFLDFVHPDDVESTLAAIGDLRDQKQVLNFTNRYRRKDGAYRWIEWRSLSSDQLIYAAARDITERKQAQETLASERQRFASILEGTNVGTWEWNIQTGEAEFNERWAEIIGYSLEELSPISIDTWISNCHPEDLAISNILIQKHFDNQLPYYECELRMRHKNGNWIWVLDRGKVIAWNGDGKPLKMCGTHQDISRRKAAEAEREHLIAELQKALAEVKTLTGIIPICASCKKIRDDKGFWDQVETYITNHSLAIFSHGLCPDCMKNYFPE